MRQAPDARPAASRALRKASGERPPDEAGVCQLGTRADGGSKEREGRGRGGHAGQAEPDEPQRTTRGSTVVEASASSMRVAGEDMRPKCFRPSSSDASRHAVGSSPLLSPCRVSSSISASSSSSPGSPLRQARSEVAPSVERPLCAGRVFDRPVLAMLLAMLAFLLSLCVSPLQLSPAGVSPRVAGAFALGAAEDAIDQGQGIDSSSFSSFATSFFPSVPSSFSFFSSYPSFFPSLVSPFPGADSSSGSPQCVSSCPSSALSRPQAPTASFPSGDDGNTASLGSKLPASLSLWLFPSSVSSTLFSFFSFLLPQRAREPRAAAQPPCRPSTAPCNAESSVCSCRASGGAASFFPSSDSSLSSRSAFLPTFFSHFLPGENGSPLGLAPPSFPALHIAASALALLTRVVLSLFWLLLSLLRSVLRIFSLFFPLSFGAVATLLATVSGLAWCFLDLTNMSRVNLYFSGAFMATTLQQCEFVRRSYRPPFFVCATVVQHLFLFLSIVPRPAAKVPDPGGKSPATRNPTPSLPLPLLPLLSSGADAARRHLSSLFRLLAARLRPSPQRNKARPPSNASPLPFFPPVSFSPFSSPSFSFSPSSPSAAAPLSSASSGRLLSASPLFRSSPFRAAFHVFSSLLSALCMRLNLFANLPQRPALTAHRQLLQHPVTGAVSIIEWHFLPSFSMAATAARARRGARREARRTLGERRSPSCGAGPHERTPNRPADIEARRCFGASDEGGKGPSARGAGESDAQLDNRNSTRAGLQRRRDGLETPVRRLRAAPDAAKLQQARTGADASHAESQARRTRDSACSRPRPHEAPASPAERRVPPHSPYLFFRGLIFIVGDEFMTGLGGAHARFPFSHAEEPVASVDRECEGQRARERGERERQAVSFGGDASLRSSNRAIGEARHRGQPAREPTINRRENGLPPHPPCSVQTASIIDAAARAGFICCVVRLSAHRAGTAAALQAFLSGEERRRSREETGKSQRAKADRLSRNAKRDTGARTSSGGECSGTPRRTADGDGNATANLGSPRHEIQEEEEDEGFLLPPLSMCGSGALVDDPSEELRLVISYVHSLCPSLPMTAIGLSLGGNTLLRLLSPVSPPERPAPPAGPLAAHSASSSSFSPASARQRSSLRRGASSASVAPLWGTPRGQSSLPDVYLQPTLLPPGCCSCCHGEAPFPCVTTTVARLNRDEARRVSARREREETEKTWGPLEADGAVGTPESLPGSLAFNEAPEGDSKEAEAPNDARRGVGASTPDGDANTALHAVSSIAPFGRQTATESEALPAGSGGPERPPCMQAEAREEAGESQQMDGGEASLRDATLTNPPERGQTGAPFDAFGPAVAVATRDEEGPERILHAAPEAADEAKIERGKFLVEDLRSDDGSSRGPVMTPQQPGRDGDTSSDLEALHDPQPLRNVDSSLAGDAGETGVEERSVSRGTAARDSASRRPPPVADAFGRADERSRSSEGARQVYEDERTGRRKRDERRGVASSCLRGTAGLPFPGVLPSSAAPAYPYPSVASPAPRRLPEDEGPRRLDEQARRDKASGAPPHRGGGASSLSVSGAAALSYLGGLWSLASAARGPPQRPQLPSSGSASASSLRPSETRDSDALGSVRETADGASSSSSVGPFFPRPTPLSSLPRSSGSGRPHPGLAASPPAQLPHLSLETHAGTEGGRGGAWDRGSSVPVASILSAVVCVGPFLEMHRCSERRNASFAGLFDWLCLTALATDGIVSWLQDLASCLAAFFCAGRPPREPRPRNAKQRTGDSPAGPRPHGDEGAGCVAPVGLSSSSAGSSASLAAAPPDAAGETTEESALSPESGSSRPPSAGRFRARKDGSAFPCQPAGKPSRPPQSLMALPPALPAHFCCPCSLQRWLAAYAQALFFEGVPGHLRPGAPSGASDRAGPEALASVACGDKGYAERRPLLECRSSYEVDCWLAENALRLDRVELLSPYARGLQRSRERRRVARPFSRPAAGGSPLRAASRSGALPWSPTNCGAAVAGRPAEAWGEVETEGLKLQESDGERRGPPGTALESESEGELDAVGGKWWEGEDDVIHRRPGVYWRLSRRYPGGVSEFYDDWSLGGTRLDNIPVPTLIFMSMDDPISDFGAVDLFTCCR
ncbi:conserved hypothetical protein [Neospora caninum Liverpool]|nr:conserved hypothetical protein [Neospora caninum Liverpool]CBZ55954.1 conserved hypothetical protein [Neospora caninum Liverpool]|eukprot:XP_003885980.1 conserved hypothetical protein [Neospora caninum Liverpool]